MKLLFVASALHLEGHGGAVTHTRAMLSLFEGIEGADVRCLTLPLPYSWLPHGLRRARAMMAGLLAGKPSKSRLFLDRKVLRIVRQTLDRGDFDAVVINSADLLPLTDCLDEATVCVLVSHNIEAEIIRGQVKQLGVPRVIRKIVERDVQNTFAAEVDGAGRCRLIVTISADDADWYRRHAPTSEIITVPGAFSEPPCDRPRPPVRRPVQLGYLADLSWWPNREGADWLVSEVLPQISRDDVEVHFFGTGSEEYEARLPMLRGHGFVEDLGRVWSSVNCTLCPIFSGSGVNIKLIESLYNGVPVLATPHAVRGLLPIDDPALVVLPPEEWRRFLQSGRMEELAAAAVKKETSELFSSERYRSLLAACLRNYSRS